MEDVMVGGVSLIVLVLGLVEFAKKLGVEGNACTVLAMVLGVLFAIAYKVMALYPTVSPWVEITVFGLAFGLAATGLYDLSKRLTTSK